MTHQLKRFGDREPINRISNLPIIKILYEKEDAILIFS